MCNTRQDSSRGPSRSLLRRYRVWAKAAGYAAAAVETGAAAAVLDTNSHALLVVTNNNGFGAKPALFAACAR